MGKQNGGVWFFEESELKQLRIVTEPKTMPHQKAELTSEGKEEKILTRPRFFRKVWTLNIEEKELKLPSSEFIDRGWDMKFVYDVEA